MMADDYLKRYTKFGWDYEIVNPMDDKKREWYINHARSNDGPVLELACGTGRLLVTLAEAGLECDGLDLCDEMLAIAGKRIGEASPEIQKRIVLHRLDITDFKLNREYGTAIIADNSLRDLKSLDRQKACLGRAYVHLRKGGLLLVTLRRLEPDGLSGGRRETGWSPPVAHPATGRQFQRKIMMQLSENNRKATGFIFYRAADAADDSDVTACPFEFPVLSTDEYTDLFREVGFSVQVQVGYENRDDDGRETITNYVCRK